MLKLECTKCAGSVDSFYADHIVKLIDVCLELTALVSSVLNSLSLKIVFLMNMDPSMCFS